MLRSSLDQFMKKRSVGDEPGLEASRADRGWIPRHWILRGIQVCFLIIGLFQIDSPFLSAHNERQNQTYGSALEIFQNGWSAVWTPKASFSLPGYEARPYTVMRQEFPFHGVMAWPVVKLIGHPRSVVRLVSISFALFSIEFIYLILQRWVSPIGGLIGAALWGLSPLILQFGQVPMPDILCTTGMLGAFWFAIKPNLSASSAWFLFAILSKVSVIFFGLPILTALVLAKNCRSYGEFLRIALAWGMGPLIGLLCWTSLEIIDPDTPWTVMKMVSRGGSSGNLTRLNFYVFLVSSLLPYGLGVLGIWGCLLAVTRRKLAGLRPALLITLLISNILYVLAVVIKIPEPQYILPMLAWLVLVAAIGLATVFEVAPRYNRPVRGLMVGLHVLIAAIFTHDLKSAHIPSYEDLERVARMIPSGSRVIAAYPFYGASPAVWLNQNVYAEHSVGELTAELPQLENDGFNYILIMDVKSHSTERHASVASLKKLFASVIPTGKETQAPVNLTDFAAPDSPLRKFCDARFHRLFSTRAVVLYALKPEGGN